jgi:exodeoxyribonuclease III
MRNIALIAIFLFGLTAAVQAQKKQTVRIMSFNLWHGGDGIKLNRDTTIKYEIAAIKAAKADVVGIQEHISGMSDKSSRAVILAEKMGWHHYIISGNRAIISRYLITPVAPVKPQPVHHHGSAKSNSQIVKLDLGKGKVLAFGVLHLMYSPYESYEIADGKLKSEDAVLASAKKARLDEVKSIMDEAEVIHKAGVPVALVGDFNEPSVLDWSRKAIKERNDPALPFAVAWPCTSYILSRGFIDAYRTSHPSVKEFPGYTWTTKPGLWREPEVHDRIDLIHLSKKGMKLKDTYIVGDQSELSDVVVLPWTSDHRAVVAVVEL